MQTEYKDIIHKVDKLGRALGLVRNLAFSLKLEASEVFEQRSAVMRLEFNRLVMAVLLMALRPSAQE